MVEKDERIKRLEEVKEKRKFLAERQDARVVFARTRDTSGLLLLVQAGDVAINRIRRGLGISVEPEIGIKAINEYKQAILDYAKSVKSICEIANVEFKAPEWIRKELDLGVSDTHDTQSATAVGD